VSLFDDLDEVLGPGGLLQGQAAVERAHSPWSRLGAPRAILRPKSTEEVSRALRLCHDARQPVVPWGGLTGLVNGTFAQDQLALSLERMTAIEDIDPINSTMTVEAGCKLQTACEAAEALDLFLPLDLGARGSATIGGNLSTNAGGNRVLRWGMARDSVLGVEAVLADGTVVTSLNTLIKNNAGYDLKHLFIGSEGTLGVITRAVLRLRIRPSSQCTAFVAVERFEDLPKLLARAHRELGGTLCAFEVMWADSYELLTTAPSQGRPIIPYGHPYYVLIEAMGSDYEADAARFEAMLARALDDEVVSDAMLAKSVAETAAMWAVRDDVGQMAREGPLYAFDVSLKIGDMAHYVAQVKTAIRGRFGAQARVWVFGHLGDGNLHVNICVDARGTDIRNAVEAIVYGPLQTIGGSISAEHGVGLQKRDHLHLSRTPEELELMARLKQALDPAHLLNRGKIFTSATALEAAT
jgi:FAD/FMN-containing dehydrogenase